MGSGNSRDEWRREAPKGVSNNPQEGAPKGRLTRNIVRCVALCLGATALGCRARSDLSLGDAGEPELVRACPDGWDDCDGDGQCDTEIAASAEDCGACGHACEEGLFCGRSECVEGDTIVQLSLGAQHSCALRARGEVLCWGWNERVTSGSARTSRS